MSDMLDRIRHELLQRLEATRDAAQEHERVRAALEALEGTAKEVTREVGRRGRSVTARARSAGGAGGSAAAKSSASPAASSKRPSTSTRARVGTRKPATAGRARSKAASASSTTAARAGAGKSRARARTSGRPTRQRAPRGANREAVLAVVRERPGVTARELAAASGVSGGTLYALLRRLTDSGELEKRDLPGGQTGYAVGRDATRSAVAAEPSQVAPADRADSSAG
jgi:hypothetical protein